MPDPEIKPTGHLPFEQLSAAVNKYDAARFPFLKAQIINDGYEEGGFTSLSEDELVAWRERNPQVGEETMTMLAESYEAARTELIADLGLESSEVAEALVSAAQYEASKRQNPEFEWWPGLIVPHGRTHGWFAEGVLAMARVTGETFRIHVADVDSACYEIKPTDTIEGLFPDLQE